MEEALADFAAVIHALDVRIAALEAKCACCGLADDKVPAVKATDTVLAENETLVNLDTYSHDAIHKELWQTFNAISDAGKTAVVTYTDDQPRNIIVYSDPATSPRYRNAGAAELCIFHKIKGTLIATLKPGDTVETPYIDGRWNSVWYVD